jgi:hypothetical protein
MENIEAKYYAAVLRITQGGILGYSDLEEFGRLRKKIRDLQSQCGSCEFWITKECPIEKSISPTFSHPCCTKFIEKGTISDLVKSYKLKIIELGKTK